jgi:predicted hotdog family 3-hydroxylacyl-ACP dehydratase
LDNFVVELPIEDYLPHRGQMLLIDKIIRVDSEKAVTESLVKDDWPLCKTHRVNPIIIIEIAAQTAGIYIAWNQEKEKKRTGKERGWLVGISSASFFTDQIRTGSTISTHVTSKLSVDTYMKLNGHTYAGGAPIGEIGLQLFWEDPDTEMNE